MVLRSTVPEAARSKSTVSSTALVDAKVGVMVGKLSGSNWMLMEYVLGAASVYASTTFAACGLPLTMTEITEVPEFATGV